MVSALHRALIDANLFAFCTDAKTGGRLIANLIFCFGGLDHIVAAIRLLLSAHVHLAAVNYDMHIGRLAVFGAAIVADNDRAVGPHHHRRAIGHADARAPVSLRLHRVAGEELRVAGGGDHFARGCAQNADISFERNEACPVQIRDGTDFSEGISVFPDV